MKISVAIPTYDRPDYLRRAIASVAAQTLRPYELIVVSRVDDACSHSIVCECKERYPELGIRNAFVETPGFLPPVVKAIDTARGDVLTLLDDDAEAHPDWLSRIAAHYSDPSVGGVGGRCINYFDGIKQEYPPVSVVAKLFWYGKPVGNMYCDCTFSHPVSADFLMGGNLSYRMDRLRMAKPDARLGENVSFHWEMDVGLQVKKMGCKVLFDPNIVVDHHSAPREVAGLRSVNYAGVYWSNYNYALLMRKHLTRFGFMSYVAYSLCVGWTGSPGLLYLLAMFVKARKIEWYHMVAASLLGRFRGALHGCCP